MSTRTAPTIDEAMRMAEEERALPKVDGSLDLEIGEFRLTIDCEGADHATTAAIFDAALAAAKRVHQPMFITVTPPEMPPLSESWTLKPPRPRWWQR